MIHERIKPLSVTAVRLQIREMKKALAEKVNRVLNDTELASQKLNRCIQEIKDLRRSIEQKEEQLLIKIKDDEKKIQKKKEILP